MTGTCDYCEAPDVELIDGLCSECRQPREVWTIGPAGVKLETVDYENH